MADLNVAPGMNPDTSTGTPPSNTPENASPAGNPPPEGTPPAGNPPPEGASPAGNPQPEGTPPEGAKPEGDPDEPAKALNWDELKQQYAKGDEKLLAKLNRYSSPQAVLDALIAAQKKISEGVKSTKPDKEKATPEELAAWREANGIPESPDKYELTLSDDVVLGEEDQAGLAGFLEIAHELDLPSSAASKVVDWYLQHKEAEIEALNQRDIQQREEAMEALREEMGPDFKLNRNLISGLLDTAPEGLKEQLLSARLPDGTALFNNPHAFRFFANLARTVNPVAAIVPGTGMNAPQAIESELEKLNEMMKDPDSAYWKGPSAAKNQERYRQLLDAKQKYGS